MIRLGALLKVAGLIDSAARRARTSPPTRCSSTASPTSGAAAAAPGNEVRIGDEHLRLVG